MSPFAVVLERPDLAVHIRNIGALDVYSSCSNVEEY